MQQSNDLGVLIPREDVDFEYGSLPGPRIPALADVTALALGEDLAHLCKLLKMLMVEKKAQKSIIPGRESRYSLR